MRTSNKVLLAAVAVLVALFLAFVLVMGLTTRDLLRRRGTTAFQPVTAMEVWCGAPVSGSPRPQV